MVTSESTAASSVRVALKLPFPADDVAGYLLRPDVVRHWLGDEAELRAEQGTRAFLPHASAEPTGRLHFEDPLPGHVRTLAWPASAAGTSAAAGQPMFELVVAQDGPRPDVSVSLRIAPCSGGQCRLRIEHRGLSGANERHASVRVWQGALNRVERLLTAAHQQRRRERQAIVVVHGIGEQRPTQMLRQFVKNVFERDVGELHFVKPDLNSSLFEMRMVTVPRNEDTRPTTDVYELYWAHLIRDTTLAQVLGWLLRLILSRDSRIPKALIGLVWTLRIILCMALIAFGWLMSADVSGWLKSLGIGALAAGLPALARLALTVLRDQFVIGYAGDAARYLEPRADNIARRQEIREAGVGLLDSLHDKGRYSRIIVYGHSLGSVIAYDILCHAWTRHARRRDDVPHTSSRALRALEALVNPRTGSPAAPISIDAVQAMQHAAWQEYRRNGFQWKVSDFVTAGSPLSHAHWLMNLDASTPFSDLVRERSFPTCPPQTESVASPRPGVRHQAFTFTHAYDDQRNPKAKRSVQVPHHGGLFALVRWTNLYFPYRGLVHGDPVAGPLTETFGTWIKDVRLPATQGFAHSRYTDRALAPEAVDRLRTGLNLSLRQPLADHAPAAPPPTVLR
ncbi:MAG: hypothetical protein LCH72_10870 [Proteobacteria bacterium]|nr:hypothetical protein [Burkholderiales bacterium]MCA0311159.1 hypothetical protein [Pseudomonadota bacterium]